MNILGLPDWQVLGVSETVHDMQIEGRHAVAPRACPHCGCVPHLYRHGIKQQRFMDLPIRGKRPGSGRKPKSEEGPLVGQINVKVTERQALYITAYTAVGLDIQDLLRQLLDDHIARTT